VGAKRVGARVERIMIKWRRSRQCGMREHKKRPVGRSGSGNEGIVGVKRKLYSWNSRARGS
jgi:hypothetical protein